MTRTLAQATLLAISFGSVAFAEDRKKETTEDELHRAMAMAIQFLESRDYAGFLERFMDPKSLSSAMKDRQFSEVAKEEIEPKAERWLRELKLVKGTTPKISDDAARFGGKEPNGREFEIALIRVDGIWYLK